MKVSFLTLGCKVNQAESSMMEGLLRGRGFEPVSLDEGPELCIINTCSVTAKSDYQSRQLIRRANRAGARVLVTGCYSELNSEDVREMEGVEGVIRNEDKLLIIRGLTKYTPSYALTSTGARTRLFLKVQDGCDRECSYCVIPRARGVPRSLHPREVVSQIRSAVLEGCKEVVLTGIHLGLYGEDLAPRVPLHALVAEILEKTSLERLRLSSLEIGEIDRRLLGLFESPRLCRHLHIPLQSGDDGVLRRMNRRYGAEAFREGAREIASGLGDAALGLDVIVGFPGESEEEFRNTVKLLEDIPFTYLHVFPYSARPGTPAADMPGQVPGPVKKERAGLLRGLSARRKRAYMRAQAGKTLEVLLEEESGGRFLGTSSNYLRVRTSGRGLQKGSVVLLEVKELSGDVLEGKPLEVPLTG